MNASKWSKPKRSWTRKGKLFAVEIVHYRRKFEFQGGTNCWNVYAYLRKGHPLFDTLHDTRDEKEERINVPFDIPLHGGATWAEAKTVPFGIWHDDSVSVGDVYCYKIGSDYAHLYDDRFAVLEEMEGSEVEADANELFDFLQAQTDGAQKK